LGSILTVFSSFYEFFQHVLFDAMFFEKNPRRQLLDSDASKEGFRIQDSVVRILEKPRRQKRVVGFAAACAKKAGVRNR
jgi:hypothetical protein